MLDNSVNGNLNVKHQYEILQKVKESGYKQEA